MPGWGVLPAIGGHVDHLAAAPGLHGRRTGFDHAKVALDVDVEGLVPVAILRGQEGAEVGVGRRVVDQNVHAAKGLHRARHELMRRRRFPPCGPPAPAHRRPPRESPRRRCPALPAGGRPGRPLRRAGQCVGDRRADAARRAGDDGDFAGQIKTWDRSAHWLYSPLNTGARFCMKAVTPSRWSLVSTASAWYSASRWMASSRERESAASKRALGPAHRQGRALGQFFGPGLGLGQQAGRRDDFVAQPQLQAAGGGNAFGLDAELQAPGCSRSGGP